MNRVIVTQNNLVKLNHKSKVIFALFCAEQVIHLVELKEVKETVRVTKLWLEDKATSEECRNAANAANAAAYAADAADAAANAAYAAANAAYAAALDKAKIIEEQEKFLYSLLYLNEIVEKEIFK